MLWGTGLYTAREQDTLRREITERLREPRPEPAPVLPGNAYAIIKIPAIQVNDVVVQGTDTESLKRGPGHYEETADPWARTGRVGIAGHRTTYGAPFGDLDRVERGDVVTLITEYGTFAYRVTRSKIIEPHQLGVLDATKKPTLVLTTCTPKFSAAQRLIVYGSRIPGRGDAPA